MQIEQPPIIEWPSVRAEEHDSLETDLKKAVLQWLDTQCSARLPAGMEVTRAVDYASEEDTVDKHRLYYLCGNLIRVALPAENWRRVSTRGKNVLTDVGAYFLATALECNQFRVFLDVSLLCSFTHLLLPIDEHWYACVTLDAPHKSLVVDEHRDVHPVTQYTLVLRGVSNYMGPPPFDATLTQPTQCDMALCCGADGTVALHYADCALVFACDAAVRKIIASSYFYALTPDAILSRLLLPTVQ